MLQALPGLSPREDSWYARAKTPGGFNKTQALEHETMMGTAASARGGGTLAGSSVNRAVGEQAEVLPLSRRVL